MKEELFIPLYKQYGCYYLAKGKNPYRKVIIALKMPTKNMDIKYFQPGNNDIIGFLLQRNFIFAVLQRLRESGPFPVWKLYV